MGVILGGKSEDFNVALREKVLYTGIQDNANDFL
jgi:hypothetical protein